MFHKEYLDPLSFPLAVIGFILTIFAVKTILTQYFVVKHSNTVDPSFDPSVVNISSCSKLPDEIGRNRNLLVLHFNSFLNKDVKKGFILLHVQLWHSRRKQILHTRLRLECSPLHNHLFSIETTKHYSLYCNKYA